MAYDPKAIRTSLKTVLENNNDSITASGLSNGLVKKVAGFYETNPKHLGNSASRFVKPWISVWALTDDEEFSELGEGARREIDAVFGVACVVATVAKVGTRVPASSAQASDDEMLLLVRNAKEIIRANNRLAGSVSTLLWASPASTEYDATIEGQANDVYVSVAQINVATRSLST